MAGDIATNPGPLQESSNDHHVPDWNPLNHQSKLSYTRDELLALNNNYRLSPKVWSLTNKLGIQPVKATVRGTRGGKLKDRLNSEQSDQDSPTTTPSQTRCNLPVFFLSNTQSLGNKMDEVNIVFQQENVDVGVITESWFNPKKKDISQMNITGYTLFSKSRTDRTGGGVAIYVKNSIPCRSLDVDVPDELECTWIEIRPHRLPRGVSAITICAVYIVTDSPLQPLLEDHLLDSIDQIRTSYPEMAFCIMGDFNRMNIDSILRGNKLKQIVTFPTRGNATLDLILTNILDHYQLPSPYSPIGLSDHACVLWKPRHRIPVNTKKSCVIRPFGASSIRAFGRWIQDQSWSEVYESKCTQDKTNAMYSIIKEGMDMHLPTKRIRIHNTDKPWITPHIKKLISERQKAFAQNDTIKWRKLRNEVKREIEKAKIKYNAERVRGLQKTEPRKWHQRIKCMLNLTNSELYMQIPGLDSNNHKDMANYINNKFVNISSHIEPLNFRSLPAYLPSNDRTPVLYDWDVYKELKEIKTSKSSGPDGIPSKLIKEFAYELSGPLTDVLNCSYREGIVPLQWKSAIVVPIPKQYPPSVDKLRPISLTDIFAKVAEGFIAKWVVHDIQDSIDIHQFGNIHGVSTAHYLLNLMDFLYQGSDKPKNVGTVVLTDFSKAFDLVNHSVAIQKLIALGVRGTIVPWICSFLSDRRQCVRYNQTLSDYLSLCAGVPQGTKLGPITFQAVINDAAVGCSSHYWKYVDDLTFAENHRAGEVSSLQGDLNDFLDWSVANQLTLNPTKCQALEICFMREPPPHLDLKIGNSQLSFVSCAKVLGIWLQSDLKWDKQVDHMWKNANKKLFMLRSLKRFGFNKSELVIVYRGYIRPLLEYSDTIWNSSLSISQVLTLERIQKRALRIILGFDYDCYDNALKVCNLDRLSTRRKQHCLKFAQLLPQCSRTCMLLPPSRGDSHGRQLRNNAQLTQPLARTKRYSSSPIPYYVGLMNDSLS